MGESGPGANTSPSPEPDNEAQAPGANGVSRRKILETAGLAAAATVASKTTEYLDLTGIAETKPRTYANVADAYRHESGQMLSRWSSIVGEVQPDGQLRTVVDDHSDRVVDAWSVNKLAVAVAVLDAADNGVIDPKQEVPITPDMFEPGAQSSPLGSKQTVESLLEAMITTSSNDAMRALQQVMPGDQINQVLEAKGFEHTRLEAAPNTGRFYTGKTTPRETQTLLIRLWNGGLISRESSDKVIDWMKHTTYDQGIKRQLTPVERERVANKYGSVSDGDEPSTRNEVGIVFSENGNPKYFYSFFAELKAPVDTRVVTMPHARLGATMVRTSAEAYTPPAQATASRRGFFGSLGRLGRRAPRGR